MFWVDEMLESPVALESVITVVDALNAELYFTRVFPSALTAVEPLLNAAREEMPSGAPPAATGVPGVATVVVQDSGDAREARDPWAPAPTGGVLEAARQVMFADVVVLSKTDVAPPHAIANAREVIRRLNPLAAIHEVARGKLSSDQLGLLFAPPDVLTAAKLGASTVGGLAAMLPHAERTEAVNSPLSDVDCGEKPHSDRIRVDPSRVTAAIEAVAARGMGVTTVEVSGIVVDGTALHTALNELLGPQRLRNAAAIAVQQQRASGQTADAPGGQANPLVDFDVTAADLASLPDGFGEAYRVKGFAHLARPDGLDGLLAAAPEDRSDISRFQSQGGVLVAIQAVAGSWDCVPIESSVGECALPKERFSLTLIGRGVQAGKVRQLLERYIIP